MVTKEPMNLDFALNTVKIQQSIEALNKRKLMDPTVEINEDTIKEEYIKRAGLLRGDKSAPEVDNSDETTESTTPGRRGRGRNAE